MLCRSLPQKIWSTGIQFRVKTGIILCSPGSFPKLDTTRVTKLIHLPVLRQHLLRIRSRILSPLPSPSSAAPHSPRGASPTSPLAAAPLSPTRQPSMGAGAADGPPLLSSASGKSSSTAASSGSFVPPDPPTAPTRSSAPAAPAAPPAPQRPNTRLQHGIRTPKVYTDGTIRYDNLASTSEPSTVVDALRDPNWKAAMNSEFEALLKTKHGTWYPLVWEKYC
jgi:hypothetical protein